MTIIDFVFFGTINKYYPANPRAPLEKIVMKYDSMNEALVPAKSDIRKIVFGENSKIWKYVVLQAPGAINAGRRRFNEPE